MYRTSQALQRPSNNSRVRIHLPTNYLTAPTIQPPPPSPPLLPPDRLKEKSYPPNLRTPKTPPRMATPSPSPSPPPPHSPSSNPSPFPKKPQPVPWTHQETVYLIQSYQDKWYSLKRGQLKSSQWEEVAAAVAARCGYAFNHPAKSAIQCRHKMEKLRRRYRDENRIVLLGGKSFWQYFELMDALERGPMPISARLSLSDLASCRENYINRNASNDSSNGMVNEDDDEEDEEEDNVGRSRSRSINYILRKPTVVNRFAGNDRAGSLRETMMKRKREEVEEEEEEMGKGVELGLGLAGEIRAFAERMARVERRKMEMMKETERWRMEVENKRMEMILDSHRKVVDLIAAVFASKVENEF